MDKTHKLIWDYQGAIVKIYEENGLTSLSGLDNEFLYNGRNVLSWYFDVIHKSRSLEGQQFDYLKNFDDLAFCSDEILYFTAQLFLYRPYINNPIKDGYMFYGKMTYPNLQNIEGKRYSMFADAAIQSAYNYWDRIGDLIASFFPGLLKRHEIYFAKVIDSIPTQFHGSVNYQWLKALKNKEFSELNGKRKQIVHFTTLATDYRHQHLEVSNDISKLEILQRERETIADYFKEHIPLTLEGFEKTLLFLEEVNAAIFVNA